jgi:hypothetical protein
VEADQFSPSNPFTSHLSLLSSIQNYCPSVHPFFDTLFGSASLPVSNLRRAVVELRRCLNWLVAFFSLEFRPRSKIAIALHSLSIRPIAPSKTRSRPKDQSTGSPPAERELLTSTHNTFEDKLNQFISHHSSLNCFLLHGGRSVALSVLFVGFFSRNKFLSTSATLT